MRSRALLAAMVASVAAGAELRGLGTAFRRPEHDRDLRLASLAEELQRKAAEKRERKAAKRAARKVKA